MLASTHQEGRSRDTLPPQLGLLAVWVALKPTKNRASSRTGASHIGAYRPATSDPLLGSRTPRAPFLHSQPLFSQIGG